MVPASSSRCSSLFECLIYQIIKKPVKAAESNLQAFGRIRWHIQQFLYRLRKHIGRKPEVILSNVFEGIGEVGAR